MRRRRPVPELRAGVAEVLSERVVRVVAPNPGMMTGPGTNTYLVGKDEVAVIDPGPDDAGHLDAVAEAGAGRIRWIAVTHTHSDHAPGAVVLRRRLGPEVSLVAHSARDGLVPDELVTDGQRVGGPGLHLRALHTPGHASNHLCFLLEEERLLFSGDHIMNGSTVVISPPDGDMSAYLASLERVRGLDLAAIAPGHGAVINDPEAKIDEYLSHRFARERAVVAALAGAGEATVDHLVAQVYTDVRPQLHPVARFSLWAHLRKLAAEGRVTAGDVDDLDTTWRPA
ncbi:MAG: MBL fold metallo-hydrolase [Actinobacteria bacterium]|nr:MBL fold metallo-hydrolase [Actinomycetota bacterium]